MQRQSLHARGAFELKSDVWGTVGFFTALSRSGDAITNQATLLSSIIERFYHSNFLTHSKKHIADPETFLLSEIIFSPLHVQKQVNIEPINASIKHPSTFKSFST